MRRLDAAIVAWEPHLPNVPAREPGRNALQERMERPFPRNSFRKTAIVLPAIFFLSLQAGLRLPEAARAAEPAAATPPVVTALVLDTSGSLTPAELGLARDLATAVLAGLPPGSEVAVFSFDDQSRVVQERTQDVDAVRRAIDGLRGSGRYTALHDALYDASRYLRDT